MTLPTRFSAAIRAAGAPAVRKREGQSDIPFCASIQPGALAEESYAPSGHSTGHSYVLYAPPEPGLMAGDSVLQNSRLFYVRQAQLFYYGEKPLYQKAALCDEVEE